MSRRGKPNKASRAREERWAAEGKTPLDVMQMAMNHFAKRADGLSAIDTSRMTKKQREKHEVLLDQAIMKASGIAEKAAPYVHPRIVSMKHGQDEDLPPLEIRVKYI